MAKVPQQIKTNGEVKRTPIPVLAVRDTVHFPLLVNTLHVVREPSLKAVRKSMEGDHTVLVLSQLDMSVENPAVGDLATVGTVSEVLQALPMPDGGLRVVLRGLYRAKSANLNQRAGSFWAEIERVNEVHGDDSVESASLMRVALETFGRVVQLNKNVPAESIQSVAHSDSPGSMADAIAHHLPLQPSQKQAVLEEISTLERLRTILVLVKREEQVLNLGAQIQQKVERELGETQREFFLREQLKVIQDELMEREDRLGETDEYRERIESTNMPPEALDKAMQELRRLDRTPAASPEGMVVRNYLDCLVSLPWSKLTDVRADVLAAGDLLDRDHFGLGKVKDRVLDMLAVRQLKDTARGPILCFVGPPGVGKTSIARSIAEATGRKFVRISLGGVRDEAEIRGHRRTYVGSMPGRIIAGLRLCGSRNPVIVLDEIDKLGSDYRGDPTSALLEALDPEQNNHFADHYLEVPFDLSAAMFIATANLLEYIPGPLRDRMEVIRFPSYTDEERTQIAKTFLIPKCLDEHGLAPKHLEFSSEALKELVQDYTREAGVRSLEREIATVCRKCARQIAEGKAKSLKVDGAALASFLGRPHYRRLDAELKDDVGSAAGLVVSESGGDVIRIEACLMEPLSEQPELKLTGNLGDVMKESASAAMTYVRSIAKELNPNASFRFDVHVHVPEGGVPKDGPSAGVTIAVCLASAFSQRPVRGDVAMTGEITLRGRVLPVGGIRDKVLAAYRSGMKEIILPEENLGDLEDVPQNVLSELKIHAVSDLRVALEIALRM